MYLEKIIKEIVGENGEFERHTVLLPVATAVQVRDLAYQLGVPMQRLIADLLERAVVEADSEWRRINLNGDHPAGRNVDLGALQTAPDPSGRTGGSGTRVDGPTVPVSKLRRSG